MVQRNEELQEQNHKKIAIEEQKELNKNFNVRLAKEQYLHNLHSK
jgi:hypothetical protein